MSDSSTFIDALTLVEMRRGPSGRLIPRQTNVASL